MNLLKSKALATIFIESKRVKKMPEEDCEGMTSSNTLSPQAQATGGNITNSDSYAPGDNRIPGTLFKKVIKRKPAEEDSEEYSIPDNFFTSEELDKIEHESEIRNQPIYEVKLKYYLQRCKKENIDPYNPNGSKLLTQSEQKEFFNYLHKLLNGEID